MLTDYHLHLRPDEAHTTTDVYFTTENVDRYRAAADAAGIEELGVTEHVYRFRQALELWSHPLWIENAQDDLDAYCDFVRTTSLRLGVECDYVPGAEERTAAELALVRGALARDMPVLGICGGEQLLAVVLGGTLLQHIPDSIENAHEDFTARQLIELRNKAENDLRHTDKGLAQAGYRLTPEQRDAIASAGAALRSAIAGTDLAALRHTIDAFGTATNPLATLVMNDVLRRRFGGSGTDDLDPDRL